jgi:hypothetical protein
LIVISPIELLETTITVSAMTPRAAEGRHLLFKQESTVMYQVMILPQLQTIPFPTR